MEVKKVFSIRTKMIALACLLGLSMVVVVITVWLSLQQNSADAHIIDIAGRQRMLTKKFATEQLYKVVAPPAAATVQTMAMDNTEALYLQSLKALAQGGQTYRDLTMKTAIDLPAPTYQPFIDQLKIVANLWQKQSETAKKMVAAKGTDRLESLTNQFLTENHQAMGAMNKAVGIYASYASGSLHELAQKVEIITAIALLIELILSIWIIRSISAPMRQLIGLSRKFSEGKLQADDSINRLLNTSETGVLAQYIEKMRSALHKTLAEMQTSSYQEHLSADQVSSLSSEISTANAEEQEQFRMMIASSDELSNASQRFGEIASDTSDVVHRCTEQSTQASEMVAQNIAMMQQTTEETERASSVISTLSSTAESVYGIVDAIRTISEQTNLLALNAAIEAARTGSSTDEISKLIGELTDGVNNAVKSMQSVAEKVSLIRDKSHQTEESIDAVRQLIISVTDSQQQITAQAEVQHQELTELKQRQTDLYGTLDESRQKSHASAIIAEQLAEISKGINENLEQFELDNNRISETKSNLDKRMHPRLKTGLHYYLQQGQIKHQGLTEDVSMGGLKIITTEALDLDKEQAVHIKLNYSHGDKQGEMSLLCDLVGDSAGKKDRHQYHLKFQSITDEQRRVLDQIFGHHRKSSQYHG